LYTNSVYLVSEDDLQKYKVPLRWRDRCAYYFALYQTCLIRQSANGKVDCGLDKHSWEECENLDFLRRKEELAKVKEAKKNDA
jgi:NADH dehydrogenase (ubiquinone) 1 beta subcomplex subunit 7